MTAISTKIKVVGVGGCGTNAVVSMIKSGLRGVDFYLVNTDRSHLEAAKNHMLTSDEVAKLGEHFKTINIGEKVTKGQGAGADPAIGEKAAEESTKELTDMLDGTDLLFIVAGMGGGTGTGASPVIAKLAKELNPEILIVSAVTTPFDVEFTRKLAVAEKGIEKLQRYVDSLIIIPNQKMVEEDLNIKLTAMYEKANRIITNAVRSISDLINVPSLINVDFADIKNTMKNKGYSHIGLGAGEGPSTSDRTIKAIKAAANTELLNTNILGATGLIINIQSSDDFTLSEMQDVRNFVGELVSKDVDCIFGHQVDQDLGNKVIVTIIAAGCRADSTPRGMQARPIYNTAQQMPPRQNNGMGYPQQPRQTSPRITPQQQPAPRQMPQVDMTGGQRPTQQPPVRPTRIDSTQGREVQNDAPSFMKRFLGRKKPDNRE